MRRRGKLILVAIVLPLALIGGCGALVARKMRPQNEPPKTAKGERRDVEVADPHTALLSSTIDLFSQISNCCWESVVYRQRYRRLQDLTKSAGSVVSGRTHGV